MVNGQHGIDRAGLAAAATMLIPGEHLFAEPGEVLPVGPPPAVATLAETAYIDRGRAAAAEEHSLPQTGEPGGTGHFPSPPGRLGCVVTRVVAKDFRPVQRQKQFMAGLNLERSAGRRLQASQNGRRSHKTSVA